jgi:hypothetical protein
MDAATVAAWTGAHAGAAVAPADLTAGFHAFLLALPWAGAGLDWRGIARMSLSLDSVGDDQVVAWARQTGAGQHDYLLLTDSAADPGVVCRFEDGLGDWDTLSARPELYMCGVDLADGQFLPCFAHYIELRFFGTLNAPMLAGQHSGLAWPGL